MTDEFVKREDVAEGARKQMRLDNYDREVRLERNKQEWG